MTDKYSDIIMLQHHQSSTRAHMPMRERAAQFSPFAAVVGYDAAVGEAARLTTEEKVLEEDERERLERSLQDLRGTIEREGSARARVTYFVPDARKSGGSYKTEEMQIKKIDAVRKTLLLTNRDEILLSRIVDISAKTIGKGIEGDGEET